MSHALLSYRALEQHREISQHRVESYTTITLQVRGLLGKWIRMRSWKMQVLGKMKGI